jgi:Spy/CpxP family protein refolding chaperone
MERGGLKVTKLKIKVLLIAAALVFSATTASFAQQAPPGNLSDDSTAYGRGSTPAEEKREAIRRKIEAVGIWKLTDALKLDTATSAKLASYLSSMDQQRMGLIRDHMMTMGELRRSLKASKPDEKSLKICLDRLEKNRRAIQELRDKELSGLKDILTTEQQARYVLFQQEFQREMREMIAAARDRGGAGRGRTGDGFGETPASR